MRKQGRHKYFALAGDEIAQMLESMMGMVAGLQPHDAARTSKAIRSMPRDQGLRQARVCYNHLAGVAGVQLYDSLAGREFLSMASGNLSLTLAGSRFVSELGINIEALLSSRVPVCRECLDWSERRSHLAGSLGRALFNRFEELQWVQRSAGSRVVEFSRKGERQFASTFTLPDK